MRFYKRYHWLEAKESIDLETCAEPWNLPFKNPNWREADQLAIYKHDRGVELESTNKQVQLSGQSGTWTRDLRI